MEDDKKLESIEVERGEASGEQVEEVKAGNFYTVREVADKLNYSYTWIIQLCQSGRIHAVKPVGGRWRIPKSEYDRMISEGIPVPTSPDEPEEKEDIPVMEIQVEDDRVTKTEIEPKEKEKELVSPEKPKKKKGFLDFLFRD